MQDTNPTPSSGRPCGTLGIGHIFDGGGPLTLRITSSCRMKSITPVATTRTATPLATTAIAAARRTGKSQKRKRKTLLNSDRSYRNRALVTD